MTAFGAKPVPTSAAPGKRRARRRTLAGSCVVGAASVLLGACSYCDENDPWRATYISTAQSAIVTDGGAPLRPPHCDVETNAAVEAAAKESGTVVDPDLMEIARLEVERDCYKKAESKLRTRVETVQPASPEPK